MAPRSCSGREIAVARVALAVIALRVLDVAFVHREPGTATGDHLASGLVPAALVVALAIAYPRLAAWWQSALAGGVGVLALVGAAGVSARHIVIEGLAGVQAAATAVLSDGSPTPALTDLVGRIAPRAALFIFAGRGQGEEDLNPAYYAAAASPKSLWEIPEAGHTGGLTARPREYERRVVAFFDRHLLRALPAS